VLRARTRAQSPRTMVRLTVTNGGHIHFEEENNGDDAQPMRRSYSDGAEGTCADDEGLTQAWRLRVQFAAWLYSGGIGSDPRAKNTFNGSGDDDEVDDEPPQETALPSPSKRLDIMDPKTGEAVKVEEQTVLGRAKPTLTSLETISGDGVFVSTSMHGGVLPSPEVATISSSYQDFQRQRPVPGLVIDEEDSAGTMKILWGLPVKTLKTSDTIRVSPPFRLKLRDGNEASFTLQFAPQKTGDGRKERSFSKSKSQGFLHLKCNTVLSAGSTVKFCFFGGHDCPQSQVVTHDFHKQNVFAMDQDLQPRGQAFSFRRCVGSTFEVGIRVFKL